MKKGSGLRVKASVICAILALTACEFRPVYGKQYQAEQAASNESLAQIEVVTDNSRLSQLLKAETEDRLNPTALSVAKTYRLSIAIAQTNIPLFVAPDGTYGRGNIEFNVSYSLIRLSDNLLIDKGSIKRVSSYSAAEQAAIYATFVTEEDARKRGIVELAHDLQLRVGNHLSLRAQ